MLSLPDHQVAGISLTEGKLVGLGNLFRTESAILDERSDKVYLTMELKFENLVASYKWKRKKFR